MIKKNKLPILLIVYKRPAHTEKVLKVICQYAPSKLYVFGDGPKNNNIDDQKKVSEVKKIFLKRNFGFECEFYFSKKNRGSKLTESNAITHFFKHEKMGIILEDDCLPSASFFKFCEENLVRFKNNLSIMHIAGTSSICVDKNYPYDYFFSKIATSWGWASWSRAWNKYDLLMIDLHKNKRKIYDTFKNKKISRNLFKEFDLVAKGHIDAWDMPWVYSVIINDGLVISPIKNLVKNIGFGPDATYSLIDLDEQSNRSTYELNKIKHNDLIEHNLIFDQKFLLNRYSIIRKLILLTKLTTKPLLIYNLILNKIKNIFKYYA